MRLCFPQAIVFVAWGTCAVPSPHWGQGTEQVVVGKKADPQAALRAWMRVYIGRGKGFRPGKGLAAALGVHPSQVTSMLKPAGRIIKAHEMPVICEYIGHEPSPEVLTGAFHSETEQQAGARAMTPARVRVRVVATHAPGMLRHKDAQPSLGTVQLMEDADPRLEGLEQYAVWIEQGRTYAICVDYFQLRPKPIAGDEVFVRRTNAAGLIEETIRKVEVVRGKVRLILNGQQPKGVDKAVAYPSESAAEKVEIVGLVIGTYSKRF